MTALRVTVLVENRATKRGLLGEHGLAMWIETARGKVLFDTGQGRALLPNAEALGVDLRQADAVALSHGHYDHAGGLGVLLNVLQRPKLYAGPGAFEPRFARNADGTARPVGVPDDCARAARQRAERLVTEGPTEIVPGLWLTGPIPRTTDEDTGGDFYLDADCAQPDPIRDDQAAYLPTDAGTVVILGCTHAGLINTLLYVRERTDCRPFAAVIGGLHLLHADEHRLRATRGALKELAVRRIVPAHCTGFAATADLCQNFPDRCAPAEVGTVLDL